VRAEEFLLFERTPCACQLRRLLQQQRQAVARSLRSHKEVIGRTQERLFVHVVAEFPKFEDDLIWLQRVFVVLALKVVPLGVRHLRDRPKSPAPPHRSTRWYRSFRLWAHSRAKSSHWPGEKTRKTSIAGICVLPGGGGATVVACGSLSGCVVGLTVFFATGFFAAVRVVFFLARMRSPLRWVQRR